MSRALSFRVLGTVVLLVAAASPAAAQIGPWSQAHPAWVDLNGNGIIDAGEVRMYPEAVYNPGLPITDPDALYIVLRNNPWDSCAGFVETRINATPLLNPISGTRRHGNLTDSISGTAGTTFGFSEMILTPPSIRRAAGPSSSGVGIFLDTNSDGVYDIFRISGTVGATPVPQTDTGFTFKDVTGDGKADYVSFPWGLTGVLGVKQTGDCVSGGVAPQVWLPLNDTNGDGKPIRVDVSFPDPSNPGSFGGLTGIPIVPANLQVAAAANVPTLPAIGLGALALALAGIGAYLLRGRLA